MKCFTLKDAEEPQLPQRDAENCKSEWKRELGTATRVTRALRSPKHYCIWFALQRHHVSTHTILKPLERKDGREQRETSPREG